ncbi:MAG: SLBB domain-containing protein [Spirochaetia bacterium]|jgi:protein involved in polysaccharide export with SLBB domain
MYKHVFLLLLLFAIAFLVRAQSLLDQSSQSFPSISSQPQLEGTESGSSTGLMENSSSPPNSPQIAQIQYNGSTSGPSADQIHLWPELRVLRAHPVSSDPTELIKRALSADEYNLTPGDFYRLSIQVLEANNTYTIVLSKNYNLEVPFLGSLSVKGMIFTELQQMITERIKKIIPQAEYVDFTLQSAGRFDVQIFGEVQSPGIITVDSLSRVSDVVSLANGVLIGGSIRQIQLLRGGQFSTVDLFSYSTTGKLDQNPYVEPGDRLFVPRAAFTVILGGAVIYPGNYELVPGETFRLLLDYAGGALFNANLDDVEIFRPCGNGSFDDLHIETLKDPAITLSDGDRIYVPMRG